MTLKEFRNKLRALNMEVLMLEVTYELEDQIIQMNTDQLWGGRKSDGSFLPDYSPNSVAFFDKPAGPIRLFEEGDFYNGFFVKRTGSFPIVIDSTDEKRGMLVADYGEEIFGLTKDNIKELADVYLKPALVEKIKNEIFV